MPTEEKRGNGVVVCCPSCGNWITRAQFEGTAELNCGNSRCKAILEVTMRDGKPTVTVLSSRKA